MKNVISRMIGLLAVSVLVLAPVFTEAGGKGHGGGHGGHGGHGGGHSGGEGGGHGGHSGGGNTGGGGTSGGSTSSSSTSGSSGSQSGVSAGDGGGAGTGSAGTSGIAGRRIAARGAGQGIEESLRYCNGPEGANNLVDYRVKADGKAFSYGGVEYALPTFAQCMQDLGHTTSTAGRNALTNFGTRS